MINEFKQLTDELQTAEENIFYRSPTHSVKFATYKEMNGV